MTFFSKSKKDTFWYMHWKKISKWFVLILPMLFVVACGENSNGIDQGQTEDTSLEDFEVFYERFHTDSIFQIEHIQWPLEGLPAHSDTLSNPARFRWQQENWVLHKPFNDALTGFSKSLSSMGEGLMVEKIVHEEGGFHMERRFAKIDDEWKLIYYAALNN